MFLPATDSESQGDSVAYSLSVTHQLSQVFSAGIPTLVKSDRFCLFGVGWGVLRVRVKGKKPSKNICKLTMDIKCSITTVGNSFTTPNPNVSASKITGEIASRKM